MILLVFSCLLLWVAWSVYHLFAYRAHSIAGKTVLITGACSEIGKRLCLRCHLRGARVIAWDYSRAKLEELQQEVLEAGKALEPQLSATRRRHDPRRATPTSPHLAGQDELASSLLSGRSSHSADESDDDVFAIAAVEFASRLQVQRAVKELMRPVDIVICAAHSYPTKSFLERGDDSLERVLDTNTLAPLLIARVLLPRMLLSKQGGQFVTITAASGGLGTTRPSAPEYAASQAGLVGMHQSLREWVRQQHRLRKTPGEVSMTLLCVDEIQKSSAVGVFAKAAYTRSASATSGGAGGAAAARRAGSLGNAATSGANPLASGEEAVAAGADVGGALSRTALGQAALKESYALDRVADRCLKSILRRDDRYRSRWVLYVHPLLEMLPVPWGAAVRSCFLEREPPTEEGSGSTGTSRETK